jgi:hypothetical protein
VDPVEITLVRAGRQLLLGAAEPRSTCPLELVDDLARFQLAARRLGWSVQLRSPSPELVELMVLVGLDDVIRIER